MKSWRHVQVEVEAPIHFECRYSCAAHSRRHMLTHSREPQAGSASKADLRTLQVYFFVCMFWKARKTRTDASTRILPGRRRESNRARRLVTRRGPDVPPHIARPYPCILTYVINFGRNAQESAGRRRTGLQSESQAVTVSVRVTSHWHHDHDGCSGSCAGIGLSPHERARRNPCR
jgi:hypothetical protein